MAPADLWNLYLCLVGMAVCAVLIYAIFGSALPLVIVGVVAVFTIGLTIFRDEGEAPPRPASDEAPVSIEAAARPDDPRPDDPRPDGASSARILPMTHTG